MRQTIFVMVGLAVGAAATFGALCAVGTVSALGWLG